MIKEYMYGSSLELAFGLTMPLNWILIGLCVLAIFAIAKMRKP